MPSPSPASRSQRSRMILSPYAGGAPGPTSSPGPWASTDHLRGPLRVRRRRQPRVMPHPLPRPQLPAELVAHPQRTAAWQAAGVGRQELRGPLWTPVLRGVHAWQPPDLTDPATRIEVAISLMPTGAAL